MALSITHFNHGTPGACPESLTQNGTAFALNLFDAYQ